MAGWGCWTPSEWKDQAHPNSESAQFRWTIILLMSSGKAKRFGPASGTENCCCTKAPTGSSNSLPRISTPLRSVIRCTHYVTGAGEQEYLNEADAPGITFVLRMDISESDKAYTEN